jgi:hypothetical protein
MRRNRRDGDRIRKSFGSTLEDGRFWVNSHHRLSNFLPRIRQMIFIWT